MATRKRTAATKRPRKSAARKAARRKTAARKAAPRRKTPLERLREICLSFSDAHEVPAWGEPTFRVKNKIFAMYASPDSHHGEGRPSVWILSVNLEQDLVVRARPDRYFKPPYVGPSGWIGAWLDRNPPWSEVRELLLDGYQRRMRKKRVH